MGEEELTVEPSAERNVSRQRGLVSVIIPTYYRNELLEEAIERVHAQTYSPLEIVVVDDSGENHAKPVVQGFDSVAYVAHERNLGHEAAYRTGLYATSGEFVQFHDDDDRLHATKIEQQVAVLQSRAEVGVVYCGVEHDTGEIHYPSDDKRGDVLVDALGFDLYPCQTTTMLLRRSLVERVQPLPYYGGGSDWALTIAAARQTSFESVPEILVERTVSHDSLGSSVEAHEAHLAIVEDHAHRYPTAGMRRSIKASLFETLGRSHLADRLWSWRAIESFGRAAWHEPGFDGRYTALLALSLGGRITFDYGSKIGRKVTSVVDDIRS